LNDLHIFSAIFFSVWAVFGANPAKVDTTVSSVCSTLHIPYFTTTNRPDGNSEFVIRMAPLVEQLVLAVGDVVEEFGWAEVAYVAHRETSEYYPLVSKFLCLYFCFIQLLCITYKRHHFPISKAFLFLHFLTRKSYFPRIHACKQDCIRPVT
jgi:hypothetical protein